MTAHSPALGLLILRVILGIVFIAHGWQKMVTNGIAATQQMFAGLGVPMADIVGPAIGLLEIIGGAALVVGVASRVFALLLAATSVGAIVLVHGEGGFFASDGGFEYVLFLGAAAVAVALTGPGRLSVDALLRARIRSREAARTEAVPA